MKKYAEVFRLSFKMQIIWRFDLAMTVVSTAARLVAAYILWNAIFQGAGLINGFTYDAMLSYYVISSVLGSIDFSHQISGEVSYLIRGGRFSGHMVKPMGPMAFFGSMLAGETVYHLGFSVISAALCSVLFRVNFTTAGAAAPVLIAAVMIPLGLAFMAAYHYFIGVLTFKFMEIDFFLHVQGAIISFATGAMVPLSMLPQNVIRILNYLPFTHVVYTPAMLITGRAGVSQGLFGLSVITAWTAAMSAAALYTYKRLRIAYDGVGI
jgi:ABC-2 type transport system permease protein